MTSFQYASNNITIPLNWSTIRIVSLGRHLSPRDLARCASSLRDVRALRAAARFQHAVQQVSVGWGEGYIFHGLIIAEHWACKTRGIFRFKIDSENSNYQCGRALHRVGNVIFGFGMKWINHMWLCISRQWFVGCVTRRVEINYRVHSQRGLGFPWVLSFNKKNWVLFWWLKSWI